MVACATGRRSEACDALKTVDRQMILIRSRLKDLAGEITATARDISRDVHGLRASLRCPLDSSS